MNGTRRKGRPAGQLTSAQRVVLRVLYERLSAGEPPSLREIIRLRGSRANNLQGTTFILDALARQGYVTISGDARGIRLVGTTHTLTIDDTPEGNRLRSALEETD